MNVGKQPSIMVDNQTDTPKMSNSTLKVDTQSARLLQKTKTVTSDSPTEKIPISKETAALVVNKLSILKQKGQENTRLKAEQRKGLTPKNDRITDGSPKSSPMKFSSFAFAIPENPGFLERLGI